MDGHQDILILPPLPHSILEDQKKDSPLLPGVEGARTLYTLPPIRDWWIPSQDIFQGCLIICEMHMILLIWRERIEIFIYSISLVLCDMCIEKCWMDINQNVNGGYLWGVDYGLLFFPSRFSKVCAMSIYYSCFLVFKQINVISF